MDKIMIFDLAFLVVFCLGVFLFIHSRKHNLKREGWMYMYRTQLGMKAIEKFSKNYSQTLRFLMYPILALGYVLMAAMIYLLCQTVYIYIAFPQISQIIKAPPVMPLIPYFPQIFGVQSLMPNFYFSYFLIALIIVAVVHEFSHGIYMRLFKTKIKSTGFVFLGPILGAFVEQDEKDFEKKKNIEQRVVLGAGVFANILTALIFFGVLVGFFYASYSPAGYVFADYAYRAVPVSSMISYTNYGNVTKINTSYGQYIYLGNQSSFLDHVNKTVGMVLYMDAPAINVGLSGVITSVNGHRVNSQRDLASYMSTLKPEQNVTINTLANGRELEYTLTLGKNPGNESVAFIGISSPQTTTSTSITGRFTSLFTSFKDKTTYYQARYNESVAKYFYNMIWWIMIINLFVGLFNMLPLGILDGGRFFYLTIWSVVKQEKIARQSYKWATRIIGLIFLAMMIAWAFSFR